MQKFLVILGLMAHLLVITASINRPVALNFPLFNRDWARKHFHENGNYFEGDIVLRDTYVGGDIKAGSYNARWRGGVIPYAFHPNILVRGRQAVNMAIKDIESKTCIRFELRTRENPAKDYVLVTSYNSGCYSFVGRDGGAQNLNLGPGCWHKTTIIHEFVHAVGFWHEQSRLDRDDYVTIRWNNIAPSYWREFSKHSKLNNFETQYDYRSVMHYSSNAFAKDRRRPTITPKQNIPLNLFGAGDEFGGLTETDALQINRMYNCTEINYYEKANKAT